MGIVILIIGGVTWLSYHTRSKESHTTKFDAVIANVQILIIAACIFFVLMAVGHYNPSWDCFWNGQCNQ